MKSEEGKSENIKESTLFFHHSIVDSGQYMVKTGIKKQKKKGKVWREVKKTFTLQRERKSGRATM